MLHIDILVLCAFTCDFYAADGTRCNAGSAAGTAFRIYFGAGKSTDGQLETNGPAVAVIGTAAAHHALDGQTAIVDLCMITPGLLPKVFECLGFAHLSAVAAEGAFAASKIYLRISLSV